MPVTLCKNKCYLHFTGGKIEAEEKDCAQKHVTSFG